MNYQKIMIVIFLLISLAACSSYAEQGTGNFTTPSVVLTESSTPTISPANKTSEMIEDTKTPSPTITLKSSETYEANTPTIQPTGTAISTLPTLSPIIVETMSICPETREVSIEELEINNMSYLIANHDGNIHYIDPNGSTGELTSQLRSSESEIFSFEGISENGQWLVFIKRADDVNVGELWLSSINGQSQQYLMDLDYEKQYLVIWIDYEQLLITGNPAISGDFIDEEAAEILLLNPFTGESENIDPLPENVRVLRHGLSPFNYEESPFSIFYHYGTFSGHQLKLYNYTIGTLDQVFSWIDLETVNIYRDLDFGYNDTDNTFDIVVKRSYGLDIGTDISLSEILQEKEYSNIMQPLYFHNINSDIELQMWFSKSGLYAFDTVGETASFYVLNKNNFMLKNYCIDRGVASHTQISFDNRFLAWTSSVPSDFPLYTVILDLETGKLTRIEDYEFLGWGQLSP